MTLLCWCVIKPGSHPVLPYGCIHHPLLTYLRLSCCFLCCFLPPPFSPNCPILPQNPMLLPTNLLPLHHPSAWVSFQTGMGISGIYHLPSSLDGFTSFTYSRTSINPLYLHSKHQFNFQFITTQFFSIWLQRLWTTEILLLEQRGVHWTTAVWQSTTALKSLMHPLNNLNQIISKH